MSGSERQLLKRHSRLNQSFTPENFRGKEINSDKQIWRLQTLCVNSTKPAIVSSNLPVDASTSTKFAWKVSVVIDHALNDIFASADTSPFLGTANSRVVVLTYIPRRKIQSYLF